MYRRIFLSLSLAATALCQLDLTSCSSTDLHCIENRISASHILTELPNFVTYPIQDDPFYATPANISQAKPGQILKVEHHTNVSLYDIPPGQSLSRIMYTSVDNSGQVVPATAAILWPFTPKPFRNSDKFPLVAWAHGTSGIVRQCAVSIQRNLQYDFRAVFTLASMGYAVVLADYVGLGSDQAFNYLAFKLHANDVVYSVMAAQSAFPQLSKDWVSFGHSEGGGVAWAIGERQAIRPIPGFLGTIAAAPPPFPIANTAPVGSSVFTAFLAFTISRLNGLNLTAIFNPVPLQVLQYVQSIGGCNDAGFAAFGTFTAEDIYSNTSWPLSQEAVDFARDYSVGSRPLGGPMLIIQGSADTVVIPEGSALGFKNTCASQKNNVSIEYVSVAGQDHNPSLYASQRIWLQWIEDRFNGVKIKPGCQHNNLSSPIGNVQLAERFLVEYEKPWITIYSSTFLPESLQAGHLGFVEPNTSAPTTSRSN
ncbi:Alpha/Beta hydrolase protein [Talaromyces proteolyticus]|uniref:Alpha/Beta hydrolase protein n=1 Tax=Talaromyces proteolyticus TaxID=1131652 RepID=A0AAD4KNC2_9EURO|nr:Alpha/Beta hydrolase protein [Talaromyces proteolyticus]KAH8696612.1 Alpha/Beta hydrolase protein [Talaromyces proteolyticus]